MHQLIQEQRFHRPREFGQHITAGEHIILIEQFPIIERQNFDQALLGFFKNYPLRRRGSRASRRPSPMKFTHSTVSEIIKPGQKTSEGVRVR